MSLELPPVAGKAYGMARMRPVWRVAQGGALPASAAASRRATETPGTDRPDGRCGAGPGDPHRPATAGSRDHRPPRTGRYPTSPPPLSAPSRPRNLRAHPAPVPHTSTANPDGSPRPKTLRRPPSLRSGSRLAAAPPPGSATLPQDPEHPVNGTAGAIRAHLGRAGPLDRQRTVGGSSCHFARRLPEPAAPGSWAPLIDPSVTTRHIRRRALRVEL